MPRSFNPGHRPNQPLFPDTLAYTTVEKVADFLQLPLPDPVLLAADTSIAGGTISIPVSAAEYRRWGYAADDKVLVYDDGDAIGKEYTLTGVSSAGSGRVNLEATAVSSESYTTAANAYVQIQSAVTNSKERGLTKSHVEHLIKIRQDYIDSICRMAWRPRIVVDEYQNFTTFKPYRRRYYTDYVGAVYLKHGKIQRILRLGVWRGDYYRELGSARVQVTVKDTHNLSSESIFLCPGAPHVATLAQGSTATTWEGSFGAKTVAQNIADLINLDKATARSAVAIGSLSERGTSLNVNDEFLATANSDEGDGNVVISSMRSTEEGETATIATTNPDSFTFAHGTGLNAKVTAVAGDTFTIADASAYTPTHGLIYYTKGGTTYVARCSRSGNTFTKVAELVSGFTSNLAVDDTINQMRLNNDITEEQRQKDWWSMEDNGAIMFNNEYPFFENHSLKVSYIYGERYVDKTVEDACTKLVAIDIMLSDDYSVLFPEGTQNVDLNAKIQRLEEEVKRLLIPFQESIIVAGMGG